MRTSDFELSILENVRNAIEKWKRKPNWHLKRWLGEGATKGAKAENGRAANRPAAMAIVASDIEVEAGAVTNIAGGRILDLDQL